MTVSIEQSFKIWNDEGWGYIISPENPNVEDDMILIKYYEKSFESFPVQEMAFPKGDIPAIIRALSDLNCK